MNLKLSSAAGPAQAISNRVSAFKQAESHWQTAGSSRHHDVKQQQNAERLADRHSRLLEVLPAGVVVINGEGIVQEANAAEQSP